MMKSRSSKGENFLACMINLCLATKTINQKNAWKEIDQTLGKPESDAQKEGSY